MDHIPTPKIDRSKQLEEAARLKNISDRAKAAHPIAQGGDLLRMVIDKSNDATLKLLSDPDCLHYLR